MRQALISVTSAQLLPERNPYPYCQHRLWLIPQPHERSTWFYAVVIQETIPYRHAYNCLVNKMGITSHCARARHRRAQEQKTCQIRNKATETTITTGPSYKACSRRLMLPYLPRPASPVHAVLAHLCSIVELAISRVFLPIH